MERRNNNPLRRIWSKVGISTLNKLAITKTLSISSTYHQLIFTRHTIIRNEHFPLLLIWSRNAKQPTDMLILHNSIHFKETEVCSNNPYSNPYTCNPTLQPIQLSLSIHWSLVEDIWEHTPATKKLQNHPPTAADLKMAAVQGPHLGWGSSRSFQEVCKVKTNWILISSHHSPFTHSTTSI